VAKFQPPEFMGRLRLPTFLLAKDFEFWVSTGKICNVFVRLGASHVSGREIVVAVRAMVVGDSGQRGRPPGMVVVTVRALVVEGGVFDRRVVGWASVALVTGQVVPPIPGIEERAKAVGPQLPYPVGLVAGCTVIVPGGVGIRQYPVGVERRCLGVEELDHHPRQGQDAATHDRA
jgi:hypothetical protein